MFKLEKINSQNSGPYVTNDNIMFNLPNYGSLDLSKSYFNIRARIDCTKNDENVVEGSAYNVGLASTGSTFIPYRNSIFFKHWRFESQKSGVIEDIRNVNVLKANLDCLTRSSSDKKSGNYNSISNYYDDDFTQLNIHGSPFSNLHSHGSTESANVVATLKMSVSEVAGVGMLDVYNLDKEGMSKGTLQLDTTYISPIQLSSFLYMAIAPSDYTSTANDIELGVDAPFQVSLPNISAETLSRFIAGAAILCEFTVDGTPYTVEGVIDEAVYVTEILVITTTESMHTLADTEEVTDIALILRNMICDNYTATDDEELGIGDAALVTTATFPYDQNELFVGQSIAVLVSIEDDPADVTETKIVSITRLASNKLSIVTADSCGTMVDTDVASQISICVNRCDMELVVEDVNLVAVRHMSKPPSPDSQLFPSWNVEQVNVPATTQYNHLFEIEPSTINVIALSKTSASANPISLSDNLSNYRIRIDDIDQTNRDIEYKSSLYYDSLIRTFNNMGSSYQLRNLYPTVGNGVEMAIMSNPVSNSPNTQMLQLSYNNSANGTAKVLSLYKQVVKKL